MSKYLGHQKTSENQQKKICLSICRKRHVFSSSLSFLVSQFTLRHFLLQDVRRYGVKVETQDQMQIDWSCWMWQCVVTVQKDAETSNLNENGDKYHCSASFWGYHRLYCAPHIWFLGTSQCQSQRVIDPPGSFRNDVLVVLPHNLSIFVLLPLFWGDLKGLGSLGWPFFWQFIYESWTDSSRLKKLVQYCTLCLGYPWAVAQNYWHSMDGFKTKYHQCGKPNATIFWMV